MSDLHSFLPVENFDCEVLILGSMPGRASLAQNQYYAHPRNYFWQFMEIIFSISRDSPYEERCESLVKKRIALWDVLQTCIRSSSLDSDIDESSIVANDFSEFFGKHRKISSIYFNGAKSDKLYNKHVLPFLPESFARIALTRLPSTSPANASISFERKLADWRIINNVILQGTLTAS